jgi:hypothetical protein
MRLALGLALIAIIGPLLLYPLFAVVVGGLVIVSAIARLVGFATDAEGSPISTGPPAVYTRPETLASDRVHRGGAVGLMLIMILWILLTFRQFVVTAVLSFLVLVVFGGIIAVDAAREAVGPMRPTSEYQEGVRIHNAFIAMFAGIILFISMMVVIGE